MSMTQGRQQAHLHPPRTQLNAGHTSAMELLNGGQMGELGTGKERVYLPGDLADPEVQPGLLGPSDPWGGRKKQMRPR